jgi:hypothetical protein
LTNQAPVYLYDHDEYGIVPNPTSTAPCDARPLRLFKGRVVRLVRLVCPPVLGSIPAIYSIFSVAGRLLTEGYNPLFNFPDKPTQLSHNAGTGMVAQTIIPSKKKGLLIGINYENNEERHLFGPHANVQELKDLLLGEPIMNNGVSFFIHVAHADLYKYKEEDIDVLLDGNEDSSLDPTNANIVCDVHVFTLPLNH